MPSLEALRAREVYRYYQPCPQSPSLKLSPSIDQENISSSSSAPVTASFEFDTSLTNPANQDLRSFSDTALTAFAQLIAIRLACQRAVVSLIDSEREYFLADSTTPPQSLPNDEWVPQNTWSSSRDGVLRAQSLCERTLQLGIEGNGDKHGSSSIPIVFISDLHQDDHLCHLDCVKGAPNWGFYSGVPLVNKNGVTIGCVYVVDERPKTTQFTKEQILFLQTMTLTIMDHLENNRAKEDMIIVTRMSQALHAFIEGDGSMDGDWEILKRYNLPLGAGVDFKWESNKDEGSTGESHHYKNPVVYDLPTDEFDPTRSPGMSPLQHTSSFNGAKGLNNSPWGSSSEIPHSQEAEKARGGTSREYSGDSFSDLLHGTFSRASNLVREGMKLDGAVFFDAPFRFYHGRNTLEADLRGFDVRSTESSSEEEDLEPLTLARPGPRPYVSSSYRGSYTSTYSDHDRKDRGDTRSMTSNSSINADAKSDILGFSTRHSSSWKDKDTSPPKTFSAIDQSLLTALVRRYPQGSLFRFDEDGPVIPDESQLVRGSQATILPPVMEEIRLRREKRIAAELKRLLAAFPGSRQIFFVPLYDSTSGCFIGSFAWSTSATRSFTEGNHLSYLVAFGHSVMSEVSRLNTLSADHAKGDFISNVSHELRSPLHGILASVEFLADTTLDGFQRNLVETVDICGRTLLDTIEHVLDFSKIKKFGQDTMQPMGSVSDLDISAIIEEVIQGVFAGFEFNGLSSQGLADMTQSHKGILSPGGGQEAIRASNRLPPDGTNQNLTVILDIDYKERWKFPTVPGTWRRLTMNVFGNALKYTPSGFIKIKLESKTMPSANSGSNTNDEGKTMVILTLSDSGQGMSSDFMKTKLFMPFSQEDVTAPGTGLGMSIVKQIVDLSGGTIDVRSELRQGTEIKLSLPLDNCQSAPESDLNQMEEPIEVVRRRGSGRTVMIKGFHPGPHCTKIQRGALSSLKASIEQYVTKWFSLAIVTASSNPDIIICDESAFHQSSIADLKFRILIILCSNGTQRHIYSSQLDTGQTLEFVSTPAGPHRLARALLNCFDAEIAASLQPLTADSTNPGFLKIGVDEARGPVVPANLADNIVVDPDVGRALRLIGKLPTSIGFSPTTSLKKISSGSGLSRTPSVSLETPHVGKTAAESTLSSTENALPGQSLSTEGSIGSSKEKVVGATPSGRVPKMLLVEDNPINMMLLETYIKKNKWELEKASNGLLAVEAFERRKEGFDVIFMDVSMPIMSGYESTRLIRQIEHTRRLAFDQQQQILTPSSSFPFNTRPPHSHPSTQSIDLHLSTPELQRNPPALIIALTGFSSQKDQEMAFQAGVDVFMTKPVRFREVGGILEGWARAFGVWSENEGMEGEGEGESRTPKG
ncbi:hypothetical protein HYALB_00006641 [Hymenoscyphus albidus]|uniref:histidine kinase n=1 Tax=Hymenoscyphus albidus TaxID=595503 RepID=A0A9N9QCV3_9HELO|nr:hypothetical protein HYALB_00006641 [Hymenoscyphus albidus]